MNIANGTATPQEAVGTELGQMGPVGRSTLEMQLHGRSHLSQSVKSEQESLLKGFTTPEDSKHFKLYGKQLEPIAQSGRSKFIIHWFQTESVLPPSQPLAIPESVEQPAMSDTLGMYPHDASFHGFITVLDDPVSSN